MDLLAQDGKLVLKSMQVQWVVQAFCRYIEDLGSFAVRELLTTREVGPVVEFIVATMERADVFVAVDATDLSTVATEVKVISLVVVERAGVCLAIGAADLSTKAFEEKVIL